MTVKPDLDELARLQKDCGIPHLPTPLTYDLRRAISGEGPRAYEWEDKPHRLVFDACREIEATAREVEALRGEVARLRDYIVECDEHAAAVASYGEFINTNGTTGERAEFAARFAPLRALAEPAKQPEGDALDLPWFSGMDCAKGIDVLEAVLTEIGYAVFPDDIVRLRKALAARGLRVGEGK